MTDVEIIPQGKLQQNVELGAVMASAGLTSEQIMAVVAKVQQVAQELALSMVPEFVELARRAHMGAALEIEARLLRQVGSTYLHGNCTRIARQVAMEQPRYR